MTFLAHSFAPSFNLRRANQRRANLRRASGDPYIFGPVHQRLKMEKMDLKKSSWKKNVLHIFSINSSSKHEKRCQMLQRVFWLFQCSKNPRCIYLQFIVTYLTAPARSDPENMLHFQVPPSMASDRDIVSPHESWEVLARIL